MGLQLTQLFAGLPAVHARHAPVHKDGFVVNALVCTLLLQVQRLFATLGQVDLPAQGLAHVNHHFARHGVVVNYQHTPRRAFCTFALAFLFVAGCRNRQGHREEEAATPAQLALQLQLATHQGDKALADDHAQSCSTKATCGGRLGLSEAAEDASLVLWGNSDAAVAHAELQRDHIVGT